MKYSTKTDYLNNGVRTEIIGRRESARVEQIPATGNYILHINLGFIRIC